eukprot:12457729-Alexandrium_andersonii.AAC.1
MRPRPGPPLRSRGGRHGEAFIRPSSPTLMWPLRFLAASGPGRGGAPLSRPPGLSHMRLSLIHI